MISCFVFFLLLLLLHVPNCELFQVKRCIHARLDSIGVCHFYLFLPSPAMSVSNYVQKSFFCRAPTYAHLYISQAIYRHHTPKVVSHWIIQLVLTPSIHRSHSISPSLRFVWNWPLACQWQVLSVCETMRNPVAALSSRRGNHQSPWRAAAQHTARRCEW